jgi:bifunctional non-homologous end joining protein LigD
VKLDGFRALAYVERGEVRLVSRNGLPYRRFAGLCREMAHTLRVGEAILDGEVVCLDGAGRPVFDALLYRRAEAPCFVAFDLLWLDGADLHDQPLLQRKRALRRIVPRRSTCVQYLDHFGERGADLFAAVVDRDLEGIVAKRKDAPYRLIGGRSPWVKIKNRAYSQVNGRHERFDSFRK